LVTDLFRKRLGRNAVFGLMAKLHEDSRGWPDVKASLLNADFFGLRNQLELIFRARGLGRHQGNEKHQGKRKKARGSLFHSSPWDSEQQFILTGNSNGWVYDRCRS